MGASIVDGDRRENFEKPYDHELDNDGNHRAMLRRVLGLKGAGFAGEWIAGWHSGAWYWTCITGRLDTDTVLYHKPEKPVSLATLKQHQADISAMPGMHLNPDQLGEIQDALIRAIDDLEIQIEHPGNGDDEDREEWRKTAERWQDLLETISVQVEANR